MVLGFYFSHFRKNQIHAVIVFLNLNVEELI